LVDRKNKAHHAKSKEKKGKLGGGRTGEKNWATLAGPLVGSPN